MMRIYAMMIAGGLLVLAGWFYAPDAFIYLTGSCETRSLVIHDEQERVVYNHAHWFSEEGRQSHRYSARLILSQTGQPDRRVMAERTFRTVIRAATGHLTVETLSAHRLKGPSTGDGWPEGYLHPLTEQGYHDTLRLFREGGTVYSGFDGWSPGLCQSEEHLARSE